MTCESLPVNISFVLYLLDDDFRALDLFPKKSNNMRGNRRKTMYKKAAVSPPRSNKMPIDQDWPSVWPVARVFHPASVPLPLHQGWVEPGVTPPGKFANAELMKIPNFLHLTPPAIQRQCSALKSKNFICIKRVSNQTLYNLFNFVEFCTEWPKELDTDEKIDHHFPLQITTSDYLHSSPTIRDARARIVTLEVSKHTASFAAFLFEGHNIFYIAAEIELIASQQPCQG